MVEYTGCLQAVYGLCYVIYVKYIKYIVCVNKKAKYFIAIWTQNKAFDVLLSWRDLIAITI